MAIIDYSYYTSTYMGEPIDGADFPRAEAKAERLITQITHGRAAAYATLHPVLKEAIRTAICAQVEYYALNGTDISVSGDTAGEWTVGKVHIGGGRSGQTMGTGASTMVCAAAIAALEQTGLLNPDVPVSDYRPLTDWWW